MLPLYAFLRGDSLGIVVLVPEQATVAQLAETVQRSAAMRVAPASHADVYRDGRLLAPDVTLAEAGLCALDRVDVVQNTAVGGPSA